MLGSTAVLMFGLVFPALAADETVTLEAAPSEIEAVAEGAAGHATGRVIVRNSGTDAITDLSLSVIVAGGRACFSSPGSSGTASRTCSTPVTLARLGSGEDASWAVLISELAPGADPKVDVYLDYVLPTDSGPRRRVATTQISISAVPPSPTPSEPPKLAEVTLKSSLTALSHERPGAVFVTVANTSKESIERISFEHWEPATMALEADVLKNPDHRPLGPGESRTYELKATADGAVVPGKGLIVVQVETASDSRTTTYVVTQEVELGVFGESEFMKAAGIPLFILVPGYIIVVLWAVLWKVVFPTSPLFGYGATELRVWIAAVPLSLLAVALYPIVTGLPFIWRAVNGPRNVLGAYGLLDIGLVWTTAIAVTMLAIGFTWVVLTGYRECQRRRNELQPDDDVLKALRKLARMDLPLDLPRVMEREGNPDQYAFIVAHEFPGSDTDVVVIPPMDIVVPPDAGPAASENRTAIEDELVQSGDPERLAQLIVEGGRLNTIRTRWRDSFVQGPEHRNSKSLVASVAELVADLTIGEAQEWGGPQRGRPVNVSQSREGSAETESR
ncbi:MAG TPA: hypothetical protein VES62_07855 [Thermoleophilaceae bacterium]|nr:hypothetical protein [Thermoleophilaceae bacterium]